MWIAVESTFGSLWNARTISEHEASSARKLAHRYLESPGCNCGETAKWFISLCPWKLHAGILDPPIVVAPSHAPVKIALSFSKRFKPTDRTST